MKNNLFNAYHDFCGSKSFFELTEKVAAWAGKIFGYDKLKVLFLEDDKLVSYTRTTKGNQTREVRKEFNKNLGCIGICVKKKKVILIPDQGMSTHHNK